MRRINWTVLLVVVAALLAGCAGTMEGGDARQVERHERTSGGYY